MFYYPTLSLFEIEQVVAFYHANQTAVLDFCTRYRAVLDRQYEEGDKIDMGELRRRFEAKQAALQVAVGANGHPAPRPAGEPAAS